MIKVYLSFDDGGKKNMKIKQRQPRIKTTCVCDCYLKLGIQMRNPSSISFAILFH